MATLPEIQLIETNKVRIEQGLKPFASVRRAQIEAWKANGRKCEVCDKVCFARELERGIIDPICLNCTKK